MNTRTIRAVTAVTVMSCAAALALGTPVLAAPPPAVTPGPIAGTPAPPAPPAAPAATVEPLATPAAPAASGAPATSAVPAVTPVPPALAPQLPAFGYLRDRYRHDDQGRALRQPIGELRGLDWMRGTWSAHVFTLSGSHAKTRDFGNTTYVFARTMNDRWLLGTDAKNTDYLYFTYDRPAGRWALVDVQGYPSYSTSYGTGSPHALVFDSAVASALGDERHLRTTLTYKDARHFTLLDEEQTPSDAYTPVIEFDFTKRS